MKIKLDNTYMWQGVTYLPGEWVEVPDGLVQALGLIPPQSALLPIEEVPTTSTKSKNKVEPKPEP